MIYDVEGKSYYEGDWVNDKPFGWGIRRFPSGNKLLNIFGKLNLKLRNII